MKPPLNAFPAFNTERLLIRPLAPSDADSVADLTNDPAITRVVHFLPSPFRRSDADALIAQNDDENCFLGVFSQNQLIGVVGVHTHGQGGLELGYWIGPKFQRRGFASEAALGVIAQMRALYPARQIFAECRTGNDASWALLHKLGFRHTGDKGQRPGRELLVHR